MNANSSPAPNSSVVVDPVSQIPEPHPASERRSSRRSAEPTLVLRSRQLDSLRAEVRRRHTAFQRRRFSSVLVWTLLGAAAVLGGALLARSWGDDAIDPTAASAPAPQAGSRPSATRADSPVLTAKLDPSSAPGTASASVAVPATAHFIAAPSVAASSGVAASHSEAVTGSAPAAPTAPAVTKARAGAPARPAVREAQSASEPASKRTLSLDELPTK